MSKMKKWGIGIGVILVLALIGSFLPDSEVEEQEPIAQEVSQTIEKETMSEDSFSKELNLLEPNLDALDENKYHKDIKVIKEMIKKSEASSSYIVNLKSKYSLTKEQDEKLTSLNDEFNKYTVHYYSVENEMEKKSN